MFRDWCFVLSQWKESQIRGYNYCHFWRRSGSLWLQTCWGWGGWGKEWGTSKGRDWVLKPLTLLSVLCWQWPLLEPWSEAGCSQRECPGAWLIARVRWSTAKHLSPPQSFKKARTHERIWKETTSNCKGMNLAEPWEIFQDPQRRRIHRFYPTKLLRTISLNGPNGVCLKPQHLGGWGRRIVNSSVVWPAYTEARLGCMRPVWAGMGGPSSKALMALAGCPVWFASHFLSIVSKNFLRFSLASFLCSLIISFCCSGKNSSWGSGTEKSLWTSLAKLHCEAPSPSRDPLSLHVQLLHVPGLLSTMLA